MSEELRERFMKRFVNVEAVNLRSIPSTENNTPVGSLTLGQEVDDLGDAPAAGTMFGRKWAA